MDYTYDRDGLRTRKVVRSSKDSYAEKVTNFLYDRQHVILETDASVQVIVRYVRSINYIARVDSSDKFSYYLYNGHGDVVQTVSAAGVVENQYEYDVFGNPTLTVEQYGNAIRYAGEYLDEEIGLYYLRARYYNPYTGRFLSQDSKWGEESNPLSLNLYTYAHNNPMMYVDPSGHDVVDDLDSIGQSISDAIIGDESGSGQDFSNSTDTPTSENTLSEISHSSGDDSSGDSSSGDSNSNREVDIKDNGDSSKLNDTTIEQTPNKADENKPLSEGLPMEGNKIEAYVMSDKLESSIVYVSKSKAGINDGRIASTSLDWGVILFLVQSEKKEEFYYKRMESEQQEYKQMDASRKIDQLDQEKVYVGEKIITQEGTSVITQPGKNEERVYVDEHPITDEKPHN